MRGRRKRGRRGEGNLTSLPSAVSTRTPRAKVKPPPPDPSLTKELFDSSIKIRGERKEGGRGKAVDLHIN